MIRLLQLNKLTTLIIVFFLINLNPSFAEDKTEDIWESNEEQKEESVKQEKKITIESPILSDDISKIEINEQKISEKEESVVGIYDPEENNLSLDMWTSSNGEDVKKILKRINKLNLSQFSENLLLQVLLTNAYSPKNNLTSEEFLKIKIDWLIKKKRIDILETLLKTNPEAGDQSKAVKFLVDEYLSSANIKLACEKINFIDKKVQNNYLDKFGIYCLINEDRKEEALMIFDLLKERGMNDKFFENKINFLLGVSEAKTSKILDNNLLNFYLSHITVENFEYIPNEKTNKYIWRYLSSANLIKTENIDNEDTIVTYERAAAENSLESTEVFNIYKQIMFNVNQLINATEVYKNLPGYKARALIYQSTLLSRDVERKLYLAFLLKDLFAKDKLSNVYSKELSNILKTINPEAIPKNYEDIVNKNLDENLGIQKVEFNNEILHKSKVLKHFLEDGEKITRTNKDIKSVYKKIKRNKKYFISIKDIIVLESLKADGVTLPEELDYSKLSSQLTVLKNLDHLVGQGQTGLLMLKIIEIIGEDNVRDLDPETIYFLTKILNEMNLKKIRNAILNETMPARV